VWQNQEFGTSRVWHQASSGRDGKRWQKLVAKDGGKLLKIIFFKKK
jgi:hypothetical protein